MRNAGKPGAYVCYKVFRVGIALVEKVLCVCGSQAVNREEDVAGFEMSAACHISQLKTAVTYRLSMLAANRSAFV